VITSTATSVAGMGEVLGKQVERIAVHKLDAALRCRSAPSPDVAAGAVAAQGGATPSTQDGWAPTSRADRGWLSTVGHPEKKTIWGSGVDVSNVGSSGPARARRPAAPRATRGPQTEPPPRNEGGDETVAEWRPPPSSPSRATAALGPRATIPAPPREVVGWRGFHGCRCGGPQEVAVGSVQVCDV